MRFDRNMSVNDMKEKISVKILQRCGRKMSKLFYKFPVLSNPIKFTEIKLLEDDDIETMVTLYCLLERIHSVVIEIDAHGEDGSDNNGRSNHESEDFSDLDVDNVLDDIDEERVDDENDYAPSIGNPSHGTVIHNDLGAHISVINLDAMHAFEIPEYSDIIPAHLMLVDPKSKNLFVGQRFAREDKCVISIKRYKVADSKLTICVGECWKSIEGCRWCV
ncbi:hypothetical protein PVK06_012227 [Gossypium arboreum]|uniref:Uncharacterized protein n=1 Tax=Gossypium arboreum TaxID=29729 RepID=A0ABR0QAT4_GOSAR|nr:hypothetical protein PVK06_012227 [Gossypium arboreum]